MLHKETVQKVRSFYDNKPLVIEGSNGSIGLSLLSVFKEYEITPSRLILTTNSSGLDTDWYDFFPNLIHLKSSDNKYDESRLKILKDLKSINVIYCSGYGRPSFFLKDPKSVVTANISNILIYSKLNNLKSFSYMSTSEVYSGNQGSLDENSKLITIPQHPRGIYIESKRLGEAIVENIIGKSVTRFASHRVALAFPPKLLKNDDRVMADLINNGLRDNIIKLNGGGEFVRQYQYGPNCAKKILASMAQGKSNLYNNSGSHIVTLAELANLIGEILNMNVDIEVKTPNDLSAPESVLIDSSKLHKEIGYSVDEELSLKEYIKLMINSKNV